MRVTLVAGMAQTGKTTLALQEVQRQAARVLILDPANSKPFETKHVKKLRTWKQLAYFIVNDGNAPSWVVALRSEEPRDYVEALEHARCYRHVTVLVDEALIFVQDKEALPWLIKAARTNAHFGQGVGVPFWFTAQRPTDLPTDIRSQMTQFYTFRHEEPRDLQFIAERCSPSFAQQVAALEGHEWLAWPQNHSAAKGEKNG